MLVLAGKLAGGGIRMLVVGLGLSLLGGCLHGGLPGRPQDVSRTVKLEISDHSFGLASIPVNNGETVRFLLHNGTVKHHDFAIGPSYKQKLRRRTLEGRFGNNEPKLSPANSDNHDAFNAVALPPGSTRELIWWFNQTQDMEFGCNMPGHYERGMKGNFEFAGNASQSRTSSKPRKTTVATARPVEKPVRVSPKKQTAPPASQPPKSDPPVASKSPPVAPVEQSPLFSAP